LGRWPVKPAAPNFSFLSFEQFSASSSLNQMIRSKFGPVFLEDASDDFVPFFHLTSALLHYIFHSVNVTAAVDLLKSNAMDLKPA